MPKPAANRLNSQSGGGWVVAVLIVVFVATCGAGYWVVRDAIRKTLQLQALEVADIVAEQAITMRAVYAEQIVSKLQKDGTGAHVDALGQPGFVPLPTQFLDLVGHANTEHGRQLYAYRPIRGGNLEPTQGLPDDFLRWAWPQLERQNQANPQGPIAWKPVYRFETQDGVPVLRYLVADAASNQSLGALSITIPLEAAEKGGGVESREALIFLFAILAASFLTVYRLNARVLRQNQRIRESEAQLANAELANRNATALLDAKKGVEEAFLELSTYSHAIDQHALVSVTDGQGRIIRVNHKFEQISGYTSDELLGKDHSILNSGQHPAEFFRELWATVSRGDTWRNVICNRAKSGRLYWVDSAIVPMKDTHGKVMRFISIRIDITEQRRHEAVLQHQATHDALTELPNRVLLLDRIGHAISRARRTGELVVVVFIDLDKFKFINDTLGHSVGDQVLCEMARRLGALARRSDTVARLGGDEFVVVLESLPREEIDMVCARISATLNARVDLSGEGHVLGGSLGVTIFPDHGSDTEALLKHADIAMYHAKALGGAKVCYFSDEMQNAIDVRVQMEARLREALERKELVLYYQIQADFKSGTLVSVEALVRWDSPHYGFLSPGQFIPIAEESKLIGAVDSYVLEAACAQMAQWQKKGYGWIRVAVNLSASTFCETAFHAHITQCLERYQIPAGLLELEVTESLAMSDPKQALEMMHQLKSKGILIAIDDFGTGYSNLGYLKNFPADRLKIDQSFVRGMAKSPHDRAIVAAIIQLAHNLNMRAIAEGVETEEDAIDLFALNVDEIQGYWLGRPESAAQVERQFTRSTVLDASKLLHQDEIPLVLVVEDEHTSMMIMETLLTSFGVKPVLAESAEQARELMLHHEFEMAMVDHRLPNESGISLLSHLKKVAPQTVRVLVTGSSDHQVLRDAINLGGASHFMSKPIDPDMLRKIVLKACWNNLRKNRR